MTVLIATLNITRYGVPESADELSRFRAVVFVERGSVQPWSFGSGQNARRVIPTGIFRTSDIEQMRMGVLEHLGIAQAPAWLFAAELREGTVIVFWPPLSEQCQSLPFGLPAAGCLPKFAFSSSTWRKLSRYVPSSIHGPPDRMEGCSAIEISNLTLASRQEIKH